MRRDRIVLGGMIALYVILVGGYVLLRAASLRTYCFDLGIHEQTVWLCSRGLTPFLSTRGLNMQEDHLSWIAYWLAPFKWLYQGPEGLLILQTFILALGAMPVYWMARARLQSDYLGLCFAGLYLVQPALLYANKFDVHFNVLLTTFLMFALWYLENGQWWRYWAALFLALISSEFIGLSVALLGGLAFRTRRRLGFLTIATGLAAFSFAESMLRWQNHGHPSQYEALYAAYGRDSWGVLLKLVQDPAVLLTADNFQYVFALMAPLLFLPLLGGRCLLPAAPVILGNLLSWRDMQHAMTFHYEAPILPFLTWGAIVGASRVQRAVPHGRRVVAWILLAAVPIAIARGPVPHLSLGGASSMRARAALEQIDPQASISAENDLGGLLADRPELYLFPNPFQRVAWGSSPQALADQSGTHVDPPSPGAFRRSLEETCVDYVAFHITSHEGFPVRLPDRRYFLTLMADAPRYEKVYDRDGLIIFKRRPLRSFGPQTR